MDDKEFDEKLQAIIDEIIRMRDCLIIGKFSLAEAIREEIDEMLDDVQEG